MPKISSREIAAAGCVTCRAPGVLDTSGVDRHPTQTNSNAIKHFNIGTLDASHVYSVRKRRGLEVSCRWSDCQFMGHQLSDEYLTRLASFAAVHPTAHAFLKRVELEGPAQGLWLSTAVNAHLYKQAAFLAYLKLKNPELQPPCLVISPRFNQQIASHTSDQSERLFPKRFDKVVMNHSGFAAKWAVRLPQGVTELTVGAPAAFFDELYTTISNC